MCTKWAPAAWELSSTKRHSAGCWEWKRPELMCRKMAKGFQAIRVGHWQCLWYPLVFKTQMYVCGHTHTPQAGLGSPRQYFYNTLALLPSVQSPHVLELCLCVSVFLILLWPPWGIICLCSTVQAHNRCSINAYRFKAQGRRLWRQHKWKYLGLGKEHGWRRVSERLDGKLKHKNLWW